MNIKLYPRHNDEYLIQFDNVITIISERSLAYILEDKRFSENDGWKVVKDKDVLALPNNVRVLVDQKDKFIHNLSKSTELVEKSQKPQEFTL
ncbi:hypothetical protein [Desulfonatronospira sp.]|uniref:hypothetical protein n=1 Tax=Desulfonatronospira sp. TaxID=1962951 RepID=UPI0025BE5D3F|nr:hypothetical protein [Desulfonatronospira sp.]